MVFRPFLRASFHWLIAHGPAAILNSALRLPFSRFAPLMPILFGGDALTSWKGVRLNVDPGEMEGYFRYFTPDAPDTELAWLLEQCHGESWFFDVGANQGMYALAAVLSNRGCRAVAFEPDPRLADRIQRNIALNPAAAGRVAVVETAVGERSGVAWFAPAHEKNWGVGRLTQDVSPGGREVHVTTLAEYTATSGIVPDVIKVDVEGAELNVLRGLGSSTSKARAMLIEIHPRVLNLDDRAALRQLLADLPFTYRFWLDESEWSDDLPDPALWPARLHAFGTRHPSRDEVQ